MPGKAASPLQTAETPAFTRSVVIDGGFTDEFSRCYVTVNGDTAKLAVFNDAKRRLTQHDILTDIKVDERDTVCIISGISQTLVGEVGVDPANARVTWTITLVGCATC